jgi:DNA polymerase-3 subunit alpha
MPDTVVRVVGRPRGTEDGVDFIASAVEPLDVSSRDDNSVTLTLPVNRVTRNLVADLKRVLSTHPGAGQVWFRLVEPRHTKTYLLGDRVGPDGNLMADLKALLGQGSVTLGKPR